MFSQHMDINIYIITTTTNNNDTLLIVRSRPDVAPIHGREGANDNNQDNKHNKLTTDLTTIKQL